MMEVPSLLVPPPLSTAGHLRKRQRQTRKRVEARKPRQLNNGWPWLMGMSTLIWRNSNTDIEKRWEGGTWCTILQE